MEKINFQDNVTKANAETMNQLQTNIENAITSGGGTLLWTNPTPNDFQENTISISDYNFIDVIFSNGRTSRFYVYSLETECSETDLLGVGESTVTFYYRNITINKSTGITIGYCFGIDLLNPSNPSVTTTKLVPLYIIGYKMNLFN